MSFSQRDLHQGNDHFMEMIIQLDLDEKALIFQEVLKEYKQQRFYRDILSTRMQNSEKTVTHSC